MAKRRPGTCLLQCVSFLLRLQPLETLHVQPLETHGRPLRPSNSPFRTLTRLRATESTPQGGESSGYGGDGGTASAAAAAFVEYTCVEYAGFSESMEDQGAAPMGSISKRLGLRVADAMARGPPGEAGSFLANLWPTVTIMVPTYQRPSFLPLALAAVAAQEYPLDRLEVLIVDDSPAPSAWPLVAAALDDSTQAGAALLKGRVRYFHTNASHFTIGAKRNFAAALARGDIIAHWDDDDYFPPSRLRLQLQWFASHPTMGRVGITPDECFVYDTRRDEFRTGASDEWLCTMAYRSQLFNGSDPLARYSDASYDEDLYFERSIHARSAKHGFNLAVGVALPWVRLLHGQAVSLAHRAGLKDSRLPLAQQIGRPLTYSVYRGSPNASNASASQGDRVAPGLKDEAPRPDSLSCGERSECGECGDLKEAASYKADSDRDGVVSYEEVHGATRLPPGLSDFWKETFQDEAKKKLESLSALERIFANS
eukprot:CAMPEP_0172597602 /NCGR_PEP_ID=MMETSP1068-20121228/17555_1 /TAXON_ID=35684 /ORGANISM="Pseudopedinella elastica, Strain CCMP716" /LENGTH=482 /DNA_ID=CAMNT_0013397149 /DNA_START=133 /DNA_END=1581 /DNA_ORIENTATION=+